MDACCRRQKQVNTTDLSSRMSTTSSNPSIPSFEQVVSGEVSRQPWDARTFMNFLRSELNDENLFFFSEVEAYKAMKGEAKRTPPASLLFLPSSAREDEGHLVGELIETFIKESSPKQVNISGTQRQKILDESKDNVAPALFEDAQGEIKRLMQTDAWPRFMRKMMGENVSIVIRFQRLKVGALVFCIYLLAFGLFLGLLVPRWYFFLLALPLFVFFFLVVSFQAKTCVLNGFRNRLDIDGNEHDEVVIQCPLVKQKMRTRTNKAFAAIVLGTIVCTGFSFAMTYAVEAGQGDRKSVV